MALSYTEYTGDGSNTDFNVVFDYLSRTHVHVYIDTIENTDFTWVSDTQIRMDDPPADDAAVVVKRVTPKTARFVNFVNGSTIDADNDLDADANQMFFLIQEFADVAVEGQLVGPQGIQGEQGEQGEQGIQGEQGPQGDPGDDGVIPSDWAGAEIYNYKNRVVTCSATTLTLDQATHGGCLILFTHASGCTITCPQALLSFGCGWKRASGAGQLIFQGDGTSTIENVDGHTKSGAAKAVGTINYWEADVATLGGVTGT
jgi:hypothetical protein